MCRVVGNVVIEDVKPLETILMEKYQPFRPIQNGQPFRERK